MKWIGRFVVLIVVLAALVVLAASPLGKWYVNSHGKELIGREVRIDGFMLNLLTGNISLDDVKIYEADGDSVFMNIKELDVNLAMAHLMEGKISIESLDVDYAKMKITQKDTVMNVDDMVAYMSQGESRDYTIGTLRMANSEVCFVDNSDPSFPFSYRINDLKVESDNFSTADRNHIVISGRLQEEGRLEAVYDGALADPGNMLLSLKLTDVDLRDFTPLFILYTGYEVVDGKLSLGSEITAINNKVNGANRITLQAPKVQKLKNLAFKPPYKGLPLKTCFYMLTDKQNRCVMDVPVTGNMDNPKFSYRKTVFNAFCKALLKTLTQPFRKKPKDIDEDAMETIN